MTLDEAIESTRRYIKKSKDPERVFQVTQIQEWLRQARGAEKANRWYTARIRELESENTKLRERIEELEELLPENGRWFSAETVEAISAERNKLRKLVRDMMQFFENGGYCDICEKAAECELEIYESDCLMRHVFKDRMHEIGIEVDNG